MKNKKNKEIKVFIINPEELERAKEEFTKNVLRAYREKKLTPDKRG